MNVTINVYVFLGLVLLAIVGGVCIGVAVGLIVWLLWDTRQNKREQKKVQAQIEQARAEEYEGMKQSLLKFFDNPGQGATV